ncbi:MAG: tetratricopeptide repeat protein [Phycisphaerales bacterium]|nr:MAG: tetratricopeptide repeat protein [Phycisphaerales bacterium]
MVTGRPGNSAQVGCSGAVASAPATSGESRICRRCGSLTPADARFCFHCGNYLRFSVWMFLPLLIIVAGLAAYYASFAGVFLFDDRLHILGDRRLKTLWPFAEELARRRRPVVDYSLALNRAIGGESAWGYHAVNLSVHLLAGLALYGIIRRTLLREPLRERLGLTSEWPALFVALIWVVHPLQTQSVTYLIQRAESLMGLFYLVTLYCVIRGATSPRGAWWHVAAVFSCALGMGSKGVMVTAPVVVLLYDRTFLSKSFGEAFRRRWGLYVGLAAMWGVLSACGIVRGVLGANGRPATVGFSYKGITPFDYALTQLGVLVEYLKLSFWPHPLCLDYNWRAARTAAEIVAPAVAIMTLVGGTVWALFRRPWLGFLGVWFFLILAPTSSFIPIKDPLFEHRMYLSLAAVVALVVIGADWTWRRLAARLSLSRPVRRSVAAVVAVLIVASLAYGSVERNKMYQNEVSMWRDVLTKRPKSPRAAENFGTALLGEGKLKQAMTALQDAVRISPRSSSVHNGLGFALVANGRLEEAIESFREAVRLKPTFARAHLNLGNALSDTGRLDEAIEQFRIAVAIRSSYTSARLNLGNALFRQGKVDEAIEQYRTIIRIDPEHANAWSNLGTTLLNKGGGDPAIVDQAIQAFQRSLRINPDSPSAHNSLGIALATKGKLDEAIEVFRQALWLRPDFGGAHYNLANCLSEKKDYQGAIRHYLQALKSEPRNVPARYELGQALRKVENLEAAERAFRETLQVAPDHAGARQALEAVLEQKARSSED